MRPLSRLTSRYQTLIAEFGLIAVVTHVTIFVTMLVSVTVLLKLGVQIGGASAGTAGALGVAYLTTQVVYPIRIGLTVTLTPIVATVERRRRQTD